MYCPNCAAPIDGVKYCRACGTNVSLVPKALTGQLGQLSAGEEAKPPQGQGESEPGSIESAASSFFSGVGMLLVALAVWRFFPSGAIWWFWLLIPAFAGIGRGVGQYLKIKEYERRQLQAPPPAPFLSGAYQAPPVQQLPTPDTGSLGSVTEHTTRHLEGTER